MRKRTPPDRAATVRKGVPSRRAAGTPRPTATTSAPPALRFLAHVVPGLEEVAAAEIAETIPSAAPAGAWKQFDERTSILEYRAAGSPRAWLALQTVEDVFVVVARGRALSADAAGVGQLGAATLAAPFLDDALRAFSACRRAAPRTFRVVARKAGTHAFRRVDAQRAVERALQTRLPRLRRVDEDADAEFWLTLIGEVGLVALRLSIAAMRGGSRKIETLPASLKPTVARAMARLSRPRDSDIVLDPFCGAGTLLLERARVGPFATLLGGDNNPAAVAKTLTNARAAGIKVEIETWDALALPLPDARVDVVLTNPPFGKKHRISGPSPDPFHERMVRELRRVLRPGGRLVLITSQTEALTRALEALSDPLVVQRRIPVLVRGERATIFVAEAPSETAKATR